MPKIQGTCPDCGRHHYRDSEGNSNCPKRSKEMPKREAWRDKMDEIFMRPFPPNTRRVYGETEIEEIVSTALSTQAAELDKVKRENANLAFTLHSCESKYIEEGKLYSELSAELDKVKGELAELRDAARKYRMETDRLVARNSPAFERANELDALLKESQS